MGESSEFANIDQLPQFVNVNFFRRIADRRGELSS